MSNQNIYKIFARYVSLNVLSMLGLSLYILADTFFVANGVGSNGLVALNLVLPVYSVINGVGLMLGIGGATRFSIAIGEGDRWHGTKIFMHVLYMALAASALFTVVGLLFSQQIVTALGASEEIASLAEIYLKTILLFSTAFILNNILVCFVRNDNNPHLAMAAMLLASISNIILDYVFVYPCGLGMFGAAFATGIAPILGMGVLSLHFIRKKNNFYVDRCGLKLFELRHIALSGVPAFINEVSTGLIMLLFNFIILDLAGNVGVGAYGIITNIALICISMFTGIAQGIQPIISLNFGQKNTANIKKVLFAAGGVAAVFGVLFYVVGTWYAHPIIAVFNSEGNTQLASIAEQGIRIYFTAFLAMGINIVASAFFACVAKPKEAFLISALRGFAAVVPLVLILPRFFEMTGVWLAVPVAELITIAVSLACLLYHLGHRGQQLHKAFGGK
ncbi:MATE family efflux transporter [Hydrogenoanaerobacterium sp.]|uniref:MATE family efflux transporter n=1 Tax=Hydrogenoanaerobacterium sp. TaxID=2953763 RepID=UPI00289E2531|nr:MATE family efflux transporter [Hydrogenoanaerobacterium sp.]